MERRDVDGRLVCFIIARALTFVGMITLAQALLMIMGELDLSLGAIGGLCGVLGGIMMVQLNVEPFLAFTICLLCGAICGLANGLLVTGLGLNSLVVTIGMAGVYSGLNLVFTKGLAITDIPDKISFLGQGVHFGVPTPFIVMLALLAVLTVVMQKTPFGRYIYAIGNSAAAAKMLGIPVNRIRLVCFVIAGFCSSLAGMLMVARLGTAQPSIGEIWVMPSIAGSVIGGVTTTGGIGSLGGAMIGATIIGVIQNIIVIFGYRPTGSRSSAAPSSCSRSPSTPSRGATSRRRNRSEDRTDDDFAFPDVIRSAQILQRAVQGAARPVR